MKTVWFLCLALLVTGCATLPPIPRPTYMAVSAAETSPRPWWTTRASSTAESKTVAETRP